MIKTRNAVIAAAASALLAAGAAGAAAQGGAARHGGPPPGPPPNAIHTVAVVPNAAGTAFDTVTFDRGKVVSAAADSVTVREGTDSTEYQAVTISVPAGSKVYRDRKAAALTDLQAGDYIDVAQGPKGVLVNAGTKLPKPPHGGPGPRGPRGFGGPGR